MKLKFLFICLLFISKSFAQDVLDSIHISGQLNNNTRFAKVVIKQFGVGSIDIAAIQVNKETGVFKITAPPSIAPGIYRFQYSQASGDYVDVILNGKDKKVEFSLDVAVEPLKRVVKFSESIENQTWQAFEEQRKLFFYEIEVLDGFLSMYPNKMDSFYQKALKEREYKVNKYLQFRTDFINKTPYYFAKQWAVFTPNYFTNPNEDWRLKEFYTFENFWQGKPSHEEALLNTPLYSEAILEYIKYYMNPDIGFSEEEMNSGFKKCVDKIMSIFSENHKTQEFALKYLQLGFKELGNEELLKYIDETYAVKFQCTADDGDLQKRLKGYETLKIGNYAPEIIVTDNEGKTKALKDFPQEKIVLAFWASWCPHCIEEMPKLQEWAKTQKNTVVLAVSLDDDYAAFQDAVKKFPNMLHYCDLQKWNGKIASDYFVAATPTFFVLDKERKIAGKYSDLKNLL